METLRETLVSLSLSLTLFTGRRFDTYLALFEEEAKHVAADAADSLPAFLTISLCDPAYLTCLCYQLAGLANSTVRHIQYKDTFDN